MKPHMLVLALVAALGSGCSSMDKPRTALQIEPVLSIRHGAPNAQSYYQLGRYYQGQKRLAQAEAAYLKAVAADGRHVDTLNALGSLYAERGELERSAEIFERVTAMAPDAAYLYNNLGFAYYLQGRQDQAYAAVRKALMLDEKLERAWDNLAQIAAMGSQSVFAEALKARRLDALPTEFVSRATRDGSFTETTEIAAGSENASPLALTAELSVQRSDQRMKLADATSAHIVQHRMESLSPAVVGGETMLAPPVPSSDDLIAGGRFILLSASREVVSSGGMITIARAEAVGPSDSKYLENSIPAVRLEVSNGNGVARFARKFSAQLRGNSIPVARITNLGSFALKATVIEYQPGYEAVARSLMERAKLTVRLVPATKPRPGSDVRIVLGRDALQFG